MTIGTAIYTALQGLVSGRVYPAAFPQGEALPTWPAIRYTHGAGRNFATICGSSTEDEDDITVQVDIVSESWDEMKTLKAAVVVALQSTDPPCVRQDGGFETFDAQTRTHRAVLSYLFQQSVN